MSMTGLAATNGLAPTKGAYAVDPSGPLGTGGRATPLLPDFIREAIEPIRCSVVVSSIYPFMQKVCSLGGSAGNDRNDVSKAT